MEYSLLERVVENGILATCEARLAAANRPGKDTNLTFEELEVDRLLIDEIHLFKNAATATKIVGMPRRRSLRNEAPT